MSGAVAGATAINQRLKGRARVQMSYARGSGLSTIAQMLSAWPA